MVGIEAMKALKGKPKTMKKFVKAINRMPSAMKEAVKAKKAMKGKKGDEGQKYEDERLFVTLAHGFSRCFSARVSTCFANLIVRISLAL